MKRLITCILCLCMILCAGNAFAKSGSVAVTFTDDGVQTNVARGNSVYTDSFKSQLEGLELRTYETLENNVDYMRKNTGDMLEVNISGFSAVHHGNDAELASLKVAVFTGVYAFEFDHPEYFWLSKKHSYGYEYANSDKKITKLYLNASGAEKWHSDAFPTYQNVLDAEQKFNDKADELLQSVAGMDTYDVLKAFNRFLIDNCIYNPKVEAGQDVTTLGEMPWCAYSAMIKQTDENKYPVCEGYAKAFKVLCDRAGIPCVLTAGTYKGNGHMWNTVKMYNGSWYYSDSTFNDSSNSETKYFLRGTSMEKTHKPSHRFSASSREVAYPEVSQSDYPNGVGASLGDANGDGKLNTADATAVLRHAAGIEKLTGFAWNCADYNSDGKVNTADATAILRYCAGM